MLNVCCIRLTVQQVSNLQVCNCKTLKTLAMTLYLWMMLHLTVITWTLCTSRANKKKRRLCCMAEVVITPPPPVILWQVASQSYFSPVSHISLRDWLRGLRAACDGTCSCAIDCDPSNGWAKQPASVVVNVSQCLSMFWDETSTFRRHIRWRKKLAVT